MPRSTRLAGLVVGLCFSLVVSAQADPVTHWHGIATTAINAGRPGPPGLLDYALVQAAVHDAVQVIEGKYQPYHYSDPSKLGQGSTKAAVAAAAHRVLVLLYGESLALKAAYESYVATNNLTGDEGLAIGDAAARAVHGAHYRPAMVLPEFKGKNEIGQWRSGTSLTFLFLAMSEPFTLNRVDQFRPQPPPPLKSVRYARDYAEVQDVGSVEAHRTADPEITLLARFWSGNFPMQWNEAVRDIAASQLSTDGDRARLLALANLAAADAAMAVWDSKYFYNIWRPSMAIRSPIEDGNPRTLENDTAWTALFGNDPNYPDYVSGANGLTGAFTGMLRNFFDTDAMSFNVKSRNSTGVVTATRGFMSFSQAAQEVVDARVLLGIHFRFADEEGRRLGERVAHWTIQKFLRPVPGNQD